jgi:DNA-binding PadR family transcriptional regulator
MPENAPRAASIRLEDLLLALVEQHPGVTGYELRAIVQSNVSHFFRTTLSQIYPALASLLAKGYVTVEDQTTPGGRSKKAYTVTGAGLDALNRFFAQPVEYTRDYDSFGHLLLMAIFLPRATDPVVRDRFSEARDFFAAELARVRGKLDLPVEVSYSLLEGKRRDRYMGLWDPVMAFLLTGLATKVAWCDEVLASLPLPPADT